MDEGSNKIRRKRKKLIFEAVFAKTEEPELWEGVDRYLRSFQFFNRWRRNANDNLKKAA